MEQPMHGQANMLIVLTWLHHIFQEFGEEDFIEYSNYIEQLVDR